VALLLALTLRFELDFEIVFFISPILFGLTIAPPPSRFLPLAFSRAPRPDVCPLNPLDAKRPIESRTYLLPDLPPRLAIVQRFVNTV
jgi:hypothetical protein